MIRVIRKETGQSGQESKEKGWWLRVMMVWIETQERGQP